MSASHVDLAQWIGANITGLSYSLDAGGNIFVDKLPSEPDRCIAVYTQGGVEADSKLPYDSPAIQIVIRSDASPLWALDTWQALYRRLHGLRHVELVAGGTLLIYALVAQASPIRLGTDDNDRHQYSLNLRTEVLNPTQERPL